MSSSYDGTLAVELQRPVPGAGYRMTDLCFPCSDMDSHSVEQDACTVGGTAADYSRGSSRTVAWWGRLGLATAIRRVNEDRRLSASLWTTVN